MNPILALECGSRRRSQPLEEESIQPAAHGRTRCQQRGVSDTVADMIVAFGAEVRARGALKYYLDRKGRSRLERAVGPMWSAGMNAS